MTYFEERIFNEKYCAAVGKVTLRVASDFWDTLGDLALRSASGCGI